MFSMLKSLGIDHQVLLDAYVLVKKIKRLKGDEKCDQPTLMLATWDTGVSVHESAIVVMANMANTGKTVQVVR